MGGDGGREISWGEGSGKLVIKPCDNGFRIRVT